MLSLKKSGDKRKGNVISSDDAGCPPLTQMVRIDGVLQEIVVADGNDVRMPKVDDFDNIATPEVLNDPVRTGIGEHLSGKWDQSTVLQDLPLDLNAFRRGQKESGGLYDVINQAVDKLVNANPSAYVVGWERDPEFVTATVNIILEDFEFEAADIRKAILLR